MKRGASDKTPFDVPFASFVAFLPAGVDGLVELCTDDGALQLIGGNGKAFSTQAELLPATVRAFSASPAVAPLQRYVERSLRQRYEQFENGTTGLDALNQALGFVELSKSAFPAIRSRRSSASPFKPQSMARSESRYSEGVCRCGTMGRIHRRRSRVREVPERLPDIAGKHTQALTNSLQQHDLTGKARMAEGEYGAASRIPARQCQAAFQSCIAETNPGCVDRVFTPRRLDDQGKRNSSPRVIARPQCSPPLRQRDGRSRRSSIWR